MTAVTEDVGLSDRIQREAVEAKVMKIIADQLDNKEVGLTDTLRELGADSMAIIEIEMALEDRINVGDISDVQADWTVWQVANHVYHKGGRV